MLNSEFRRVSSFTNFSQNCVCIFQNLSIIFYVIFPSLKIERTFSSPMVRLEDIILAVSLYLPLWCYIHCSYWGLSRYFPLRKSLLLCQSGIWEKLSVSPSLLPCSSMGLWHLIGCPRSTCLQV